jgi:hypothetical protein
MMIKRLFGVVTAVVLGVALGMPALPASADPGTDLQVSVLPIHVTVGVGLPPAFGGVMPDGDPHCC